MFFYGMTDIGRKRATNQDSFLTRRFCDNVALFVLCDGMGGTNGGNIASGLAATTFADFIENAVSELIGDDGPFVFDLSFSPMELMQDAVTAANSAVFKRSRENSELSNMGTTLVCALIINSKMYIANVGDSRLYSCVHGQLEQLTHDHSYVQMLVDMQRITKEEAATHPSRNILTRAVGTESSVEADVTVYDLPKNELYFLLCSDGLYNFLSEENICNIIESPAEGDEDDYEEELCSKTKRLIDCANEGGGGDNITAILIKKLADE